MARDEVVAADKSIKMKPAASVLHLEVGGPIRLDEANFLALSEACFAEIEARYVQAPTAPGLAPGRRQRHPHSRRSDDPARLPDPELHLSGRRSR